jgi:hypothetical protein
VTYRSARTESFSLLPVLAVLVALGHVGARAQYYEEREYKSQEVRYVYLGAMQRDFSPSSSNTAPDSARIKYTKLMPMIGFRQGLVDLFIGYTKFDQHGKSNTALFVGTVVSTEFPVLGSKSNALLMPLMFAADYTKAESGGPERENFNIASLGLGAGLTYRLSTQSVNFSLHAGELVQFATQGLSTGSGFSAATLAEASLVLREIVLQGIALGYRFRYQTWSMSDTQFNYRAVSHGPYLGVLF